MQPKPIAHDSLTRLLHRLDPNSNNLLEEAKHFIDKQAGIVVLDDSTLDKLVVPKLKGY